MSYVCRVHQQRLSTHQRGCLCVQKPTSHALNRVPFKTASHIPFTRYNANPYIHPPALLRKSGTMNFMATLLNEQLKQQQEGIAEAIIQPLWQKAASFAAHVHASEVRDGEIPPSLAQATRVALTVASLYHCPEPPVLAAALLHNVLDKSDVSFEELCDQFGRQIATRVQRLSREPELDTDVHLKRLHSCDWQTRLIKLADAADTLDHDDEQEELESRIMRTTQVMELAFGAEEPVQRAQRHLTELLQNVRLNSAG
jgi:(p)ppGpp synthase/HD superfamily hydrolase